jgi:hypothetical protein
MTIVLQNEEIELFCNENPLFDIENIILFHIRLIKSASSKDTSNALDISELEGILKKCNNGNLKDTMELLKNEFNVIGNRLLDSVKASMFDNDNQNKESSGSNVVLQQLNELVNGFTKSSVTLESKMDYLDQSVKIVSTNLSGYLEKMKVPGFKGVNTESKIDLLLTEVFPEHDILHVASRLQQGKMDLMLIKDTFPVILIDTKDYTGKVPKTEVEKFENDIILSGNHGIMFSPQASISGKRNFQMSFIKGKVALYIANTGLDIKDLVTGIHLIYNIDPILGNKKKQFELTFDAIEKINVIINENITRVRSIKTHLNLATEELDSIMFDSLKQLLGLKSESGQDTIKCEKCGKICKNIASLGQHSRKCK